MAAPATTAPVASGAGVKPIIGVPFYSTYGHIATLAEEVIAGIESAGGIAKPYFIQETLSAEILEKMHAGASLKPKYPLLQPQDLCEMDGFIFGFPTRYGRAPGQVSHFFDQTGGLWASQALNGKYASTFTSSASQHGGQELTHLTTLPFFVHHGCIYVPIGYKEPYLSDNSEAHGTSPWGTSTVANGDGSRVPTEGEKRVARFQGEHFTKIVAQAVRGRHLLQQDAAGGAGPGLTAAQTSQTGAVQPSATQPGQPGAGAGTAAGVAAGAVGAGAAGAAVTGAARSEAPLSKEPDAAALAAQEKVAEPTGPAAPTAKDATNGATTGTTPAVATTGSAAATGEKAATTGASAPATGAAGAPGATRPTATAPRKKSGGLFSCCSGNSID